jgi:hypothetical protein
MLQSKQMTLTESCEDALTSFVQSKEMERAWLASRVSTASASAANSCGHLRGQRDATGFS